MSANRELVELGDVEELTRHVGRLAHAGAWDELVELCDLCRSALERGRQLWPVAALAEYRLALDAPAQWAACVLVTGAGRFAPGPLPEVAASTHTWAELAPWVQTGTPEPAIAAHERVVRGEAIAEDDPQVMPGVLELPLSLQPWEPAYPVAVYEPDKTSFPLPALAGFADVRLPSSPPDALDDGESVRALLDLASAWTRESNGRAQAVAVAGSAAGAVAALGVRGACRMVELSPAETLARMAWTAASGGAHARRRGMAAGRFAAWWTAAALVGLLSDQDDAGEWPPSPHDLGDAMAELRWFAWDAGGPATGWSCRLAAEDPADGLAWALTATDAAL